MTEQKQLPYPSLLFYAKCLRPKHISPKREVQSVGDISSGELRQAGIQAIIFDVDNTLCPYGAISVDKRVEENFRRLVVDFRCCILSNTDTERMSNLERYFGIPAIQTRVRKPRPEAFIQALDYLKTNPSNTAMVGDRLLSDIAGANMAGLLTIKVNPLERSSEPFAHTLVRAFENLVYCFYIE